MSVHPIPDIDVERALIDGLVSAVAGDQTRIGTNTPGDLASKLPFLRVLRYGGGYDNTTGTDRADVDLDGFGPTRDAARAVLYDALTLLLPGSRLGDRMTIDTITVLVSPRSLPYENPAVRKWSAAVSITTRS